MQVYQKGLEAAFECQLIRLPVEFRKNASRLADLTDFVYPYSNVPQDLVELPSRGVVRIVN